MQISPSEELTPWIRHYLIYFPQDFQTELRFFSDGSPGLVIPLERPCFPPSNAPSLNTWDMLAYGIFDNYVNIPAIPRSGLLIVVLQPYALAILSGKNAAFLKNRIFLFRELISFGAHCLEANLVNKLSIQQLIAELEDFIYSLTKDALGSDRMVIGNLQKITLAQHNLNVETILREIHLSQRQLERKFGQYLGVSPKKYTSLLRFNYFLKLFKNSSPGSSSLQAALQAGYYDQAHLNNYFKSATGLTPTEYKLQHDPTALNLIRVIA